MVIGGMHIRFLFCALAMALTLFSCKKAEKEEIVVVKRPKTVLLYMVANNNLSHDAENSISRLQNGYIPSDEGNLLVYKHCAGMDPVLLHIKKGEDGTVAADTAYRFPPRVSATKSALTQALNVTQALFPADSYGLILWSHGTGWIPPLASSSSAAQEQRSGSCPERTFGLDGKVELEIRDLAQAIPYKLSFMLMDACFMGGIETAYEVKDSVDYYIGSPAEILTESFPYHKIMQHIFKSTPDYAAVCKEYYDYYNAKTGSVRSATVALMDCSKLAEVAEVAKRVFDQYGERIASLDLSLLQPYFRGSSSKYFYDLKDLVDAIADASLSAEFAAALERAVPYKASTPYFIELPIRSFCGVSTYVPGNPADTKLADYYKQYKWNQATGMIK
ncbi:MAG: clostripain-related cysteine peptidase [Candidatus Egerieousia sp.]|nr:clostripain-related cysteine peptidase [Candidatus Egerieousia sp.]